MFSTHILSDVERICDNIAVLNDGKLALSGTLSEVKSQHKSNSLQIEFSSQIDKGRFMSESLLAPFIKKAEQTSTGIIIHTHDIQKAEATAIATLFQKQILPMKFEVLEPNLESLFMEVVK